MFWYLIVFHLFCSLCCASESMILENLCTTLDAAQTVAKSAPLLLKFPYLQVPADFLMTVPKKSSWPHVAGVAVPEKDNRVNVPCLQQRKGLWPHGKVMVVSPFTGKPITYDEIKARADGTNCGWHALKNALCLLNVRFRPDMDKGMFLDAMQSPEAFLDLLKPWLELVLPFRRIEAPGEYASHPLGNWPGEAEMDIALGRTNGVLGYDEEFAAVDKALEEYQWAPDVDLRNYISFISRFKSSFTNPKTTREEHLAVIKKVCLNADADHAFVVNTSANSDAGLGYHWVEFFLHKKNGVITWFFSDSLATGFYADLQATLDQVFTQTPAQVKDFEDQVLYGAMIENATKLVGDFDQLKPEYQYGFKGILVKDVALGAADCLTKDDLVALGFADSVDKIADSLLASEIQKIHRGLWGGTHNWMNKKATVLVAFYNEHSGQWLIMRQGQNKPEDMKLVDVPVKYGALTRRPKREEVARAIASSLPDGEQDAAVEKYMDKPEDVAVDPLIYWRLCFSNWPLAMTPDPLNGQLMERFYWPPAVIVDVFEKLWKSGFDPLSARGGSFSMKDKKIWPERVRAGVLKAMFELIDYVVAHKETWPLDKVITIDKIPDTRAVPRVDQHDPPLFGTVTHELSWWILETLKKTMPLQDAEKPQFEAMVASLRVDNSAFADQVAALVSDE